MKVSILMNGYNCERYVAEAIRSILKQSYQDWELVFVDNASTDATGEIVAKFQDPRIKYHALSHNLSLGKARAIGLTLCTGDLVGFLDTDDVWYPEKLSLQVGEFIDDPELVFCYTGNDYIDENSTVIGRRIPRRGSGPSLLDRNLERYEVNQQTVLVRGTNTIAFDADKKYSVDYDCFMQIIARYKSLALSQVTVGYRIHNSNLSRSVAELEWKEQKSALDRLLVRNPNLSDSHGNSLRKAYARVYYYKARYLVSIGHRGDAICTLSPYKFVSPFYFILFCLLLLPKSIWDLLHSRLRKFS